LAGDKKISNIKRLRQIINTFVKYGLGHMVKSTGLDTYISVGKRMLLRKGSEEAVKYTNPQRMVMVFEELGPTFIKLGQILSTRKGQLPKEYLVEFEKLQDSTPSLPFEKIDMVFETEFGESTTEVFESIDKTPIASASIGQVHAARLKTGEEVVVKIRKPGIEHVINADIKILYFLANQIEKIIPKDNEMVSPVEIVKEFETVIRNELDFVMEGRNIERFQYNFKDNSGIHFPAVYWEYSSPPVLVMERIEGIPIGDVKRLREEGQDLRKIARNLFDITLKQMFLDAFFHADPHPGNFIIMENGVIGIVDCGMVGFMEEYFVNSFIDCFVGLFLKDDGLVVKGYMAVGTITEDTDIATFKNDVRNIMEHYRNVSLNTVGIGAIFDDVINLGVRNKIKIPAAMFLIAKTLVSVEGTIKKVDPTFDLVEHSTKFAKTLIIRKRFDPKKIVSEMVESFTELPKFIQAFPRQTSKILSLMEEQKLTMNVALIGLDDLFDRLDHFVGCIALAVIAAGLAVGSSLVIYGKVEPLWHGLSLFGIFGYVLALLLGFWVVLLFAKKGR